MIGRRVGRFPGVIMEGGVMSAGRETASRMACSDPGGAKLDAH